MRTSIDLVDLMPKLDQVPVSRDDGSRMLLAVQLIVITGVQLLELLHQSGHARTLLHVSVLGPQVCAR
eukprot:SAG11_NODE_1725_length_4370_cov_13.867947_1_plen_68_part_00